MIYNQFMPSQFKITLTVMAAARVALTIGLAGWDEEAFN